MLNRDSNGHVIRLSRDLTDHVTCVVTRLGPDGVLLGDPPVQGPLPPRSARPASPEPTPPPQVRAARLAGGVWYAREGRGVRDYLLNTRTVTHAHALTHKHAK